MTLLTQEKRIKAAAMLLFVFSTMVQTMAQNRTWNLQTADTKITFSTTADGGVKVLELKHPAQTHNWARANTALPLIQQVDAAGKQHRPVWQFKEARASAGGNTLTLRFASQQPAMELTSVWQAEKGPGPVRNTQTIKNNSGATVTIYAPESADFALGLPAVNNSLVYINDDASIPDKVGVYRDPVSKNYNKTLPISEVQDWIPFMALNAADQHGVYIGWEWSIGRLSMNTPEPGIARLKAGISDSFKTDISAGEAFEVPPVFIGTYIGNMDDCGNRLRKYLFQHAVPAMLQRDAGFPKAQWNAFAALGKGQGSWDPVEAKYYPLVDDIAPLGFEELVIDVGWWISYGDPGHIIVDSVDWPRGMPAAARYAKERGIRFGLYDNESENLTSDSGKRERISDVAYLIDSLGADFYRSDNTAGPVIAGDYGPSRRARYKEDVSYWSIKGFYEVIDSLYRRFPNFLWENCSSGGGLKDFGAVRRCARVQNQDVYWPVQARRSFWDASHVFPPMQLASVVGSWAGWQASGSVYEFRSASMGAAYWHPDAPNGGNGGPVWTAAQKVAVAKAVATYKQRLRPLIRMADLYHVFPRPDSVNWDGIEYFDPVKEGGVVYCFKPAPATDEHTIKLRGLDPDTRYRLSFEDGTNKTQVLPGKELMTKGITIRLEGSLVSELMFIEKVK